MTPTDKEIRKEYAWIIFSSFGVILMVFSAAISVIYNVHPIGKYIWPLVLITIAGFNALIIWGNLDKIQSIKRQQLLDELLKDEK